MNLMINLVSEIDLNSYNSLNDIYCNKDYISLYLKDGDEIFTFSYTQNENLFFNISIKKKIERINNVKVDDGFFDLESAYGYGGFYTNTNDASFIQEALDKYREKCLDEKIIAEFFRFNVFNDFAALHKNKFDMCRYDRDTVYIDLNKTYDEIYNSYKTNLRRNIKKANQNNLKFHKFEEKTKYADKFFELYTKTMLRNEADEFYFFSIEYFKRILGFKETLLYAVSHEDKIINMVILLSSDDKIYYHLGATDPDFYNLNTNHFIFDNIVKNYVNSKKILYLGGGTSGLKDDPLFRFKQQFSSDLMPFYICGNVYNRDVYKKYNEIWLDQSKQDCERFLKYRMELK